MLTEKLILKKTFGSVSGGGGGRTRVIENGAVFEKGGVNISAVHGELPESMKNYFKVKAGDFFACGLSMVIHPKNPFVPTVHANWRYFELYNDKRRIARPVVWWRARSHSLLSF
jgi:coproporphyrinogen III oxidase